MCGGAFLLLTYRACIAAGHPRTGRLVQRRPWVAWSLRPPESLLVFWRWFTFFLASSQTVISSAAIGQRCPKRPRSDPGRRHGVVPRRSGRDRDRRRALRKRESSGKLPVSFPCAESDLPPFDDVRLAVTYGYFHGYRHLAHTGLAPLFPFGFGLSYASSTSRSGTTWRSDRRRATCRSRDRSPSRRFRLRKIIGQLQRGRIPTGSGFAT